MRGLRIAHDMHLLGYTNTTDIILWQQEIKGEVAMFAQRYCCKERELFRIHRRKSCNRRERSPRR